VHVRYNSTRIKKGFGNTGPPVASPNYLNIADHLSGGQLPRRNPSLEWGVVSRSPRTRDDSSGVMKRASRERERPRHRGHSINVIYRRVPRIRITGIPLLVISRLSARGVIALVIYFVRNAKAFFDGIPLVPGGHLIIGRSDDFIKYIADEARRMPRIPRNSETVSYETMIFQRANTLPSVTLAVSSNKDAFHPSIVARYSG